MRFWNGLRLPARFFCCICLLWPSFAWVRAQTFNLQTDRENITSLDGLWRFHTGDNPEWASPNFDDSKWPLLRSDRPWSVQGYKDYSGYAWYRFTIQVPDGSQPLSLLLMPIVTSYRVYVDGRPVGGFGYMPPRELALSPKPRVYDLSGAGEAGPRTFHIAIRVWQFPAWAPYEPGGIIQPGSVAGSSSLIHRRLELLVSAHRTGIANTYTYGVITLLFGLIVLGLFLFRPAEREYLWFALLLLAAAVDTADMMSLSLSLLPVQIYDIIDGSMLALFQIAGLLFFSRVLRVRRDFWWWFACIAAAIASISEFTYILHWSSVAFSGILEVILFLPSQVWILAILLRKAARRDADARLLLIPVLLDYGLVLAENLRAVSYQLGWQSRLHSVNPPLLQFPYPLRLQDVTFTIFAVALMLFLVRRFALARREETRLASELEAARGMQSLLIPAVAPSTPGFAIESVYIPASEVGGDFFQVRPGDDGSLMIVVGDVSGKGLKAAMTVSTIVGALRGCSTRNPAEVLAYLNRVLYGQIAGFATCCVALIASDGTLNIANAGHLSPYLNGRELTMPGGLPLGMQPEGEYEEARYRLAPDDRLTFLSDGVVEARNKDGALYGFERTQRISNQPAAAIAETAKQFGQEDDITVLSVLRSPVAVHAI